MEYVTEAEQSSMQYVSEAEQSRNRGQGSKKQRTGEQEDSMEQETEAEQYQVFINHRGPDTKKNLASLIYHNLSSYGLRVFLDNEELRTGNTIWPAIRGAISSASVHIAIFSEKYAESKWCLDELCLMLKSSSVIPVFYDVEPADLRRIDRGPYAQAFDKHRQRVSREVVEGWKEALREAADISGLPFKTKDSDYGEFVKEIGKIVRERVRWDPLDVAPHPVGLDQTLKELDDLIQKQSSTRVVVIAGTGGIGKSTLAKKIFNSRRSSFSRASYLSNFRDKVDLTSFQRQLLRELLGHSEEITNSHTGKTMLRNGLKGLKVLIILDDVDDRKKIKSVLDMNAVGAGSLIFITSRDKDILRGSSADTLLYDVRPLKRNHARVLFCHHAFHQSNPLEGYEDSVEEFLKICGGLPLCLKVLGEQLSGKLDGSYWKQQLEIFYQGLPLTEADTVINTLKWSYTAMGIDQQEMLLDVGCFFVGEDLELAVRVLEGLEYLRDARNCLERLRPKCLVDFNNDVETQDEIGKQGKEIEIPIGRHLILPTVLAQRSSKIIMQNQVRELARRIAREALRTMDKPLRLSCSIDIEQMLQLQSGSVLCRGICIRNYRRLPQLPNHIHIRGVRLLVVEHPIASSWFLGSGISGELVWLRWRNCRFISLPRTISLRNLRVLELQYPKEDIEKFFDSIDEIPSQLRELNIDARKDLEQPPAPSRLIFNIPRNLQGLGAAPSASSRTWSSPQPVDLQHSTKSFDGNISTTWQGVMPSFSRFLQSIGTLMKDFDKIVLKNVTGPQSLPFDCSELKNLRHLDLSGSTNLTTLPNSFSQLLQLQHLALRDCTNLSIPTDILGEISTLEHIDLKGCAQLVHLPQGISSQRRLRYLNLLQTSLLDLPFHLEPVDKLEQLRIGSATLTELPNSVAHFVNLKELILVECVNLSHISTPIEQLAWLERLEIYGSKLPILPAGIAQLKHLRVLSIYNSPIKKFAFDNNVMDALTDLTLINTFLSEIIIPAGACPRLEIVDLSYNYRLRRVRVSQPTLVKLNLDDCWSLKYLRLAELVQLKCLNINGCGCVETLSVKNWRSLEEIRAERCWFLRMGEGVWNQLEQLNFFSFSQLFIFWTGGWTTTTYKAAYLKGFEKFMLNSFRDVTVLEVPATTTATSPLLLKNVHSHTAILMCFLTTDNGQSTEHNKFKVRFEACNGGARSEEFKTASGHGRGDLLLHMYMWTHNSKLFKDEDDIYSNVAIYKEGNFDVEGGDRGWILTFESQNPLLNVCSQIMKNNMSYFYGCN